MYRHGSCSRNCILSLFFTPAAPVDEVCLLTHPHVPLPLGFPNPSDRQKAQVLWNPVPTQRRKFHISIPIKGRKHSLSQEVMGCTHLWANIHLARGQLPLLAWLVWGEEGPGGCKASREFTAALSSLCQCRKPWCTHILMSISRGNCRLETKQALALQFGERPGVRYGWGSQNHQSDGEKRLFRTVTGQILQFILWVLDLIKVLFRTVTGQVLQFILWVMDLMKEKLPYCELMEVHYGECGAHSANGFQKKWDGSLFTPLLPMNWRSTEVSLHIPHPKLAGAGGKRCQNTEEPRGHSQVSQGQGWASS